MSQIERLRELATKGYSKSEAGDREGVSPSTAVNALKGTGLEWAKPALHWQPYGLDVEGAYAFSLRIYSELSSLRSDHSVDEVSHLIGMNMGEQKLAYVCHNERPLRAYNWTLASIARLAKARGKSFQHLMNEALAAMNERKLS